LKQSRKGQHEFGAQSVFSDYFGWSAHAPKAGMIPLHKTVLGLMLDRQSEKDIIEIADLFAKVKVKNMILILSDYNAKAFLDVFEPWLNHLVFHSPSTT
jgi:hypothetical protein